MHYLGGADAIAALLKGGEAFSALSRGRCEWGSRLGERRPGAGGVNQGCRRPLGAAKAKEISFSPRPPAGILTFVSNFNLSSYN